MESIETVLRRTRTLTFDCYGTLIDWRTGLASSLGEVFGPAVKEHVDAWFDAYVKIEAEVEAGPYRSYREVLAEVERRLAERFEIALPPERVEHLAATLPRWTPFPDTSDALVRLKKRFRLGVLSNIDRDLFAATARHFPVGFDFVVTAQDVRAYKPQQAHFRKALVEHAACESLLHVAQSLYHDGGPTGELGIAYVWINRYKDPNRTTVCPLATYADLGSLADAVARL